MEIRIQNDFNESRYEGYEVENLALYSELKERIKGYVREVVSPDDIIDLQKSSSFGAYSYDSEYDKILFMASVTRDMDENLKYCGDYYISVSIHYMSIHALESSFLETSNWNCGISDLRFTAY